MTTSNQNGTPHKVLKSAFGTVAIAFSLFAFSVPSSAKSYDLSIMSGPSGGSYYPIAAGLSQVLGNQGASVNVEQGGGIANIIGVSEGQAQLGVTTTTSLVLANEGKPPFKKKYDNIRALATLFLTRMQIAVTESSGVKTIAELKGKKFNCGSIANATQSALVDAMQASGISEKDVKCSRGSLTFATSAIKDGQVIGMTILSAYPNSSFAESFTTQKMRLLPMPQPIFEKMKALNSGYDFGEIPAGTYTGQDEAVPVVTSKLMLIANASMPDEEAYWIVKTFIDNIGEVRNVQSLLKDITPKYMSEVQSVELHPGAIKAYKEAGVTFN